VGDDRRPVELWAALALLAFCPLFAALYPLTQLYQYEEDRARGDRTLALVLGMRMSLLLAIARDADRVRAARGWRSRRFGRPLVAEHAADRARRLACRASALVPAPPDRMTPAQHKRGMYAALHAWAVTDVAVLATFVLP
jgi:lycopene elongase/hydratase (dihydrobisanhydrobacterioruberin-forming)